jgi:N-formylglutamate deformylase
MDWLHVTRGEAPLVVSIPHAGAIIPSDIEARLVSPWLARKDADWWLPELYAFVGDLDATVVRTGVSRTVIDVNRDPSGVSLYPGQATTGLCPVDTFDKTPVYADGSKGPDDAEIAQRRDAIWHPYHAALQEELKRLKAEHGTIALWDAHSIRSVLPRFFDGKLTDFNLGSADGASCDKGLADDVLAIASAVPAHTAVLNGRFKGGYITRQYGNPANGVHAIQLELTQSSYMEEVYPFAYDPSKAGAIQPAIRQMLETVLGFVEAR